ncbi:hypothetical protein FQN54_002425 [Arachnomyces sp. PD_36]|nr:hypothetical protein FQN54_002425 [Arachnomyces sp. PD_36]
MKHLNSLLLFLGSAYFTSSAIAQSASGVRAKYNFNSDWKVVVDDPDDAESPDFDDSDWKDVTTPYAWNEDDAFHEDIADLSTGVAWYRKPFDLPASAAGKKVFLEFEGIRHGGEFYVNGEWVGRSENGVMAFGFDITDFLAEGESNVLAARIDSSWDYREVDTDETFQWNDDNFYANYGGINKNVYLHITDNLYQTLPLYSNLETVGVYVYAQDIDVEAKSAEITAETEVRNEYSSSKTFSYQVLIQETDGTEVHSIDGGNYTLGANETKTFSASDTVSDLEFWSWGYGYLYDVSTIISVNGQPVDTVTTRTGFRKTEFENGMVKLNDRALQVKGYAQRTTNEWVALGSAVPAWISDFSNQLVLECNGNLIRWMHVTPWKQDVESLDRLGLLQAMPAGDSEGDVSGRQWEQRTELMRDAIIYNRNNPSVIFYETGNEAVSEEHMSEIIEIRDTYDPHGGRAAGSREMLDTKVAEYGGEMLYINKGADIPYWSMEYSRDEGMRVYWDEFSPPFHKDGDGPPYDGEDASEYNRNQDSHAIEDVTRWFDYYEQRPGTGKRVNAGGVNIVFSDSNTHHRGESNYRTSGEVDAVRLPKDGWYAHQVMWNNWVDIEEAAVHIIGHWNYAEDTVKNVTVVSTAEKVELLRNGKSLGFGEQSKSFLFSFTDVEFEAGELEAVGYDANDEKVASDVKSTAGEGVALRLTPRTSPTGFHATGADIALVDVEVVDADGNRNPIALNMVNFTLSGAATWRGGIARGPDNYILSTGLPVENGVNRVLLRSTTEAGEVTLDAVSDGLESDSITLNTVAFNTTGGLSLGFPSDGLDANLSRGPTPKGNSFTLKRQDVAIASASSSVDANETAAYDSNELSFWTTEGLDSESDNPWITFELESEASVNEVVLKMDGFQDSEFPLEISVGDEKVWEGNTPVSLGYVTLGFNATVGKSVTITSSDGGDIGIVEAEIYAPVE